MGQDTPRRSPGDRSRQCIVTASAPPPRRRGEPLIALTTITVGWIAVRAVAWQSPFPPLQPEWREIHVVETPSVGAESVFSTPAVIPEAVVRAALQHPARLSREPAALASTRDERRDYAIPSGGWTPQTFAAPVATPIQRLARPTASPFPTSAPSVASVRTKHLHLDGWFVWRSGSSGLRVGGQPFTYGASQAGVLARLDLSGNRHVPQVYARALYAPGKARQADLAVGLSGRPVATVPIRLQAEGRATQSDNRAFVRPAILAVTELAPLELPLGVRAEGYAQAGWVGGRYSTGFVDGQARIDRELIAVGPAEVRIGAGAWGGAQKSAGRLDIGPSVTLDLRDTPVPARISVDYRYRALGDANPGSGVALTLSTGF